MNKEEKNGWTLTLMERMIKVIGHDYHSLEGFTNDGDGMD